MKQTVYFMDFQNKFRAHGRIGQFSYSGLRALFDYIEMIEECTGEQIELDVIALCSEYTEYESLEEFHEDYDKDAYPDLKSIEYNTRLIMLNGGYGPGFIIQAF